MKLIRLNDIFEIRNGHSLELNRLTKTGTEGVPFVSRQMGNNGVSAHVELIRNIDPAPAGDLSCALSGNGVLSTFVQERPFYTSFHVACLRPRVELSLRQKHYYCVCIKANKYKFSFGRQANRTLGIILVPNPSDIPPWIETIDVKREFSIKLSSIVNFPIQSDAPKNDCVGSERNELEDLFQVVYGHSLELNRLKLSNNGINFVSRTSKMNGVSARIEPLDMKPAPGGLITVACGGSVLETFLQLEPFYCGRDIYWLVPRISLTVEEKLFYCHCIRLNKFRYNYGRQANKTLKYLKVPSLSAIPSWVYGSLQTHAKGWMEKLYQSD